MSSTDTTLELEQRARIEALATRLHGCRRLLFITGAGISADSGLPTYRGVGGLYDDAGTEDGIAIEEALSGAMMVQNPALCWKYIMQIEAACRGAQPNAGHRCIAALESRFEQVWVLTQNVDGLHRAAGSSRVIDIHGDVREIFCPAPGCPHRVTVDDYEGLGCPPRCPRCDAVLRPDVVLFGEALPMRKLSLLREELLRGFDAVFSIGTTSVFPYIAGPVIDAARRSVLTIEINPGRSQVSDLVALRLELGAATALAALQQAFDRGFD
jgi:NAD-dependent deacetylase